MTALCERKFCDVVGRFPAGVSVATACGTDGERVGVTISSLTSVSLRPPLITFTPAVSVRSLRVFREAKHFAVSILAEGQHDVLVFFRSASIGWRHRPTSRVWVHNKWRVKS